MIPLVTYCDDNFLSFKTFKQKLLSSAFLRNGSVLRNSFVCFGTLSFASAQLFRIFGTLSFPSELFRMLRNSFVCFGTISYASELFRILCNAILRFKSADKTLKYVHSYKSNCAVVLLITRYKVAVTFESVRSIVQKQN